MTDRGVCCPSSSVRAGQPAGGEGHRQPTPFPRGPGPAATLSLSPPPRRLLSVTQSHDHYLGQRFTTNDRQTQPASPCHTPHLPGAPMPRDTTFRTRKWFIDAVQYICLSVCLPAYIFICLLFFFTSCPTVNVSAFLFKFLFPFLCYYYNHSKLLFIEPFTFIPTYLLPFPIYYLILPISKTAE